MHKSKYLHRFLSASVHCIHLRVKFRDYYKMRLPPKNDQMLSGLGNVNQFLVLLFLWWLSILLAAVHTCSLFVLTKYLKQIHTFVRERSKKTRKGGNILCLIEQKQPR